MPDIRKLKYILTASLLLTAICLGSLIFSILRTETGWVDAETDDPSSLQFKELGDVDFCVLLLYDGSISASYTRDLARFLTHNRIGVAQMEFASPDTGHIAEALTAIERQCNLPAEKMLLLGIGDAAGHLARSVCTLPQRVLGTALIQTRADADSLLDNGVFSCSYAYAAAKTLIIGDTDCAKAMTELYNLLAADRILATGGTYKAQKDGVSLTVAPSAPLAGAVFSQRFFNELGNWLQAQTGIDFSDSMYPAIRPLAWLGTLAGLFAALLSGYLLASRTFLDGSYSVVFTARNHSGLFIAFRSVFWLISSIMAAVLTALAFWLRLPLDPIGAAYVLYVLSASAVSAILCRAGLMPGVSRIPQRLKEPHTRRRMAMALTSTAGVLAVGSLLAFSGLWASQASARRLTLFLVLLPLCTIVFWEHGRECLVVESLGLRMMGGLALSMSRYTPLILLVVLFVPMGLFFSLMLSLKIFLALTVSVLVGRLADRLCPSFISGLSSSLIFCSFIAFLF